MTVLMPASTYVVPNTGLCLSHTFSHRTLATPYYAHAVVNLVLGTRKLSFRGTGGLAHVGRGPGECPGRPPCPCCSAAAECTDQGTAGSEDPRGIRRAQNKSQTTSTRRGRRTWFLPGPPRHLGDSPRLAHCCHTRFCLAHCCHTRSFLRPRHSASCF